MYKKPSKARQLRDRTVTDNIIGLLRVNVEAMSTAEINDALGIKGARKRNHTHRLLQKMWLVGKTIQCKTVMNYKVWWLV